MTLHLGHDSVGDHAVTVWQCGNPACKRVVARYRLGQHLGVVGNVVVAFEDAVDPRFVVPVAGERPVDPTVPADLAREYREAAVVLPISPKASAALSRRLLQRTIRETKGIDKRDLWKEIDEVIAQNLVSSGLAEQLNAVRHIGNFAAHPNKSQQTGEIVDVEPGEAGWNLDVLDGLFEEWFVQPAARNQRLEKLNAKLVDAGKKPLSSD